MDLPIAERKRAFEWVKAKTEIPKFPAPEKALDAFDYAPNTEPEVT